MPTDRARPVFVEFPDFGFGPATAALTLIRGLGDRYDWHVVSTGSAAGFVRAQLENASFHDLDTFREASWPRFAEVVPPDSVVVSITNPGFAAWAARTHRVGVVDTLHWMWPSEPDGIERTRFRLVQEFFGVPATNSDRRSQVEVVRPILDPDLWRPGEPPPEPGEAAVIGFGGMHLPVPAGHQLFAEYTTWFLDMALPLLLEEARLSQVTIVGGRSDLAGLVPKTWVGHNAVRVCSRLPQRDYAALIRSSRHLLLSPGLGTIYESAASGVMPLLQPGASMSMALQTYHLGRTGYVHLCTWPWLEKAIPVISELPEPDAILLLAGEIRETIKDDYYKKESLLEAPIRRYLRSDRTRRPLALEVNDTLPSAVARLAHHLDKLF